jgi:hypothetical protein
MEGRAIQMRAAVRVKELPGAYLVHSFGPVEKNLPRAEHPVDPRTFGQAMK